MLFADLYVESINLDIANGRAAGRHGDDEKREQFEKHLIATLKYCSRHGLIIAYNWRNGVEWTLQRTSYTPVNLHILLEGREGFENYTRSEPNRHARRHIIQRESVQYDDPCGRDEPNYGLHGMY